MLTTSIASYIGDPLYVILHSNRNFDETTKDSYFEAFDAMFKQGSSLGDPYFELLELNDSDTRLLQNKNGFTAYCNYVFQHLSENDSRRKMLNTYLSRSKIQVEQKQLFELPERIWAVPTVDFKAFFHKELKVYPKSIIHAFSDTYTKNPAPFMTKEHLKYTILNPDNVFHTQDELLSLCKSTETSTPANLVVYKPKRLALHAAIANVVVSIQIKSADDSKEISIDYDNDLKRTVDKVMEYSKQDINAASVTIMKSRQHIEKMVNALVAGDGSARGEPENANVRSEIEKNKLSITALKPKDEGYDDVLIALTVDTLYKSMAESVMDDLLKIKINEMVEAGELSYLEIPTQTERLTYMVSGGQGSGKSTSVKEFQDMSMDHDVDASGWENVLKGSTDRFRMFLIDPQTIHPELYAELTKDEAGYINNVTIQNKLKNLFKQKKAPHMFFEQCFVGKDKIEMGLENGGKVKIIIVSTELLSDKSKKEIGALDRAYARGKKINRYSSVRNILFMHKNTTIQLIQRIIENSGKNVYMKMVDNNVPEGYQPKLFAEIDCLNKVVKIHDNDLLSRYVKKIAINVDAATEDQIYDPVLLRNATNVGYFTELMKAGYQIEGLTLANTPMSDNVV